jgi:7-keto-8-aminopelargonate synthetase-like enzyme
MHIIFCELHGQQKVHVDVCCCCVLNRMCTKLEVNGRTKRCLNLGSYNYLGFAAADDYCTPRVLDTLKDWGISNCSSRTEAGVEKAGTIPISSSKQHTGIGQPK